MPNYDELFSVLTEEDSPDHLLLYTDGMHSLSQPSYFEFFAEVSPVASNNCLLVTASGEMVILTDLQRDVERISRHSAVEDIRYAPGFADGVVELIDEFTAGDRLGLAGGDRIPYRVYARIGEHQTKIVDMETEMAQLTREKTPRELEVFRKLGEIADRGFRALYDVIRPGMKEYEIAAEVEFVMRSEGAEDNFNLFGSGSHNDLLHAPTERVIDEGDVFLCELSPVYEGYVLQICRTISVGSPDQVLTAKYGLLKRALAEAKHELRPATPASVIPDSMNKVFREEGYAAYCKPPYMRTRGHEFGFGPIGMAITEETTTRLHEGMVLVIHPNQYIPETGYLALGDPVLITEEGSETLTDIEPRLFTKEVLR